MIIMVKFVWNFVAIISIVSCLQQQSNPDAATTLTTTTTEETDEHRKLLPNFSLASFLPPVSKITLPKLPAIPKRNTITLTTTVLTQKTKRVVVHPTCLRLHNVQSVCNGHLETIVPTPILPVVPLWKSSEAVDDADRVYRGSISPSATQQILATEIEDSPRKNILEPSEHEYEYTSSLHDPTDSLALESESETRNLGNFIDNIMGPKYKIVTKHLTVTKVIPFTDYAHTATIVAVNCLPPNLPYILCDLDHINPFLVQIAQRNQNKKTDQAAKQTVSKVYEAVNKFYINNPHGILGISPQHPESQFYGALNSDGIPSLLRTAEQFPYFGKSLDSTNSTDLDAED